MSVADRFRIIKDLLSITEQECAMLLEEHQRSVGYAHEVKHSLDVALSRINALEIEVRLLVESSRK
jgi:hypothetical protein